MERKDLIITCPVCGEHTFTASDDHTKCPVCGWVNDAYQTEHIFVGHAANFYSLAQQKKAWKILNLEYEVGYGTDNLLWGTGTDDCGLCHEKISIDECKYHMEQLLQGKLPAGCTSLKKAQQECAHCIMKTHEYLSDTAFGKTAANYYDGDTYGNGQWFTDNYEYDIEYYQKMLKSLINYCHQEDLGKTDAKDKKRKDPDFNTDRAMLMDMMAADATGRRNLNSHFCRTLLSIADFIRYATDEQGNLDHKFCLWAFGENDDDEKYQFAPEEKINAAKVLHMTLSFCNYRCDQFTLPGLYYLDNTYRYWDVDEFDDTIAAWFVDIGDELNEKNMKDFIIDTLEQSFAYSHVKLVLHMLHYLGYAKTDKKIYELVQMYSKVPSLATLAQSCI